MATTPKGIYYPNDYNEIADIPEDMKKMAESIEEVFEDTDSDLSDIKEEQTTQNNRLNSLEVDNTTNKSDILTNKQDINNIKAEQTTQNTNIQINADNISALTSRVTETEGDISDIKEEQTTQNTNISTNATNIESLQEENETLKKIVSQLPQVTGQGTSITLENTIEAQFTKFDEEGNSVQDGSPSPDNEVPILSSGDNGSINEKIQTRNLVDGVLDNSLSATVKLITKDMNVLVPAGTYTISFTNKPVQSNGNIFSGSTNILNIPWYSDKKTFTLTETTLITRITCDVGANQIVYAQLQLGSTATPYVPHEEQDYSIFVQQPMRSIDDVRDLFFKNTVDSPYYDENLTLNGWYERHFIARKIFDGTEDWQFYTNSVTGLLTFRILMNEIKLLNHRKILSNNFKVVDSYTPINGEMDNHFDNYYNLECVYTEMKNVTEFKNWLAQKYANGNPAYIDYKPEKPLDLPCTEEQIQQLENKPSTYKDFTIINSEDETPAYLEVSGIRDINTMFDKITNAIVSLGGNV